MNTSFFDSNAVNPEMALINEPLISSNCSETSSVSSKESSQLGDFETEMDNICFKKAEQFVLLENTLEEKVEENLVADGKFNKKFMLVGDNADLLVKSWHMSRDRSNRHLHVFHMIAVKKRIPIPEDLIHIRIPQIKNIVNEVNLQDFIPCGQDKARLRFETEILVLRDLLKLIDELKWPYLDLLNSLYGLIIDWMQLLHSNILSLTQPTKGKAAYSMVYLTTFHLMYF